MTDVLDVLVVGAGFAGICAGKMLLDKGIENFKVFEKSDAIGGTWYHNTYPGAACDVASHFYCYSFEPNPNWSAAYSPQPEILDYIRHCAKKYGVEPKVELGHKVDKFELDERSGLWTAHFAGGHTQKARMIINGMGGLHVPKFPEIDGMGRFDGPAMHSALWDHNVDFDGKSVAIIGSAASAIQIIPELAKICSDIKVFQRTPNYVTPRHNKTYTNKQKARMAKFPILSKLRRLKIYIESEFIVYRLMRQDKFLGKLVTKQVHGLIKDQVKNPEKEAHLIPDYTIGCKRILVSDDFYNTLSEDHVHLIPQGVKGMTKDGVVSADGTLHTADILVFATGYDIDAHLGSVEVIGKDGVSLRAMGKEGHAAFKGTVQPDFPNYFMVTGPNTGVGSTSVVHMIELQVKYIAKLVDKARQGKLISPTRSAMEAYNVRLQDQLSRSVWASGCDSWYLRDDGKIVILYPGSARDFAREHKRVDWTNYDVVDVPA